MNCITSWLKHPCKNTLVTSVTYLKNQITLHLLDQTFSTLKSVLYVKENKIIISLKCGKKKKIKVHHSNLEWTHIKLFLPRTEY